MKELTKLFDRYLERECVACGEKLEMKGAQLTYLGSVFTLDLPTCPSCGITLIPEELATGKMLEVEKILEDK